MLVSIIINNYNYGRFLKDAIDSALGQTYRPIEVIVVDDGSTDNSREIIADYGQHIIPILQSNSGQAAALNVGFARCRGDVVIFLDSDDVLLPQAVQHTVRAFQGNPGAARVHHRMEVIDTQGERTGVLKPHQHLPLAHGDLRQHVLHFPDDMPWLPTSGNAYATGVLRQIFPIPAQEFRILADVYLSHITPLFGPVIGLSDVSVLYRVHGGNNYEVSRLNIAQLRSTVMHWRAAHVYIRKFALALRQIHNPHEAPIQSIACLANQLISLKLDPADHPVAGDSVLRLLGASVCAAGQRFNVSWLMKLFYVLWFVAIGLSPRPLAYFLACKWHFPESRKGFSKLLGQLQRVRSARPQPVMSARSQSALQAFLD